MMLFADSDIEISFITQRKVMTAQIRTLRYDSGHILEK